MFYSCSQEYSLYTLYGGRKYSSNPRASADCWKTWIRMTREKASFSWTWAQNDHISQTQTGVWVIAPQSAFFSRELNANDMLSPIMVVVQPAAWTHLYHVFMPLPSKHCVVHRSNRDQIRGMQFRVESTQIWGQPIGHCSRLFQIPKWVYEALHYGS